MQIEVKQSAIQAVAIKPRLSATEPRAAKMKVRTACAQDG
jgi:hypothetical protein